jgi:hypothetical protein
MAETVRRRDSWEFVVAGWWSKKLFSDVEDATCWCDQEKDMRKVGARFSLEIHR